MPAADGLQINDGANYATRAPSTAAPTVNISLDEENKDDDKNEENKFEEVKVFTNRASEIDDVEQFF